MPETLCKLPDGGSVFYSDPQVLCPLCDPNGFGEFMNKDLFPELSGTFQSSSDAKQQENVINEP